MENFGLLTFRESLLLIDSESYSVKTRTEVALVVCHEISHQWFGNLVTMVNYSYNSKTVFIKEIFNKNNNKKGILDRFMAE
jgi:aminopeptidase N